MNRIVLAVVLSGVVACSSGGGGPLSTYRLDLSHFENGHPARFSNESLAFRPDLGAPARTLVGEDETFRKVYNRLPCQTPEDQGEDDHLAEQGFQSTSALAAAIPIRLESVSLEMPDDATVVPGVPDFHVGAVCYAYRTSDGEWHGHFTPVATTHDDVARLSRITLDVGEDDVDIVGVDLFDGYVSTVTYVARPE